MYRIERVDIWEPFGNATLKIPTGRKLPTMWIVCPDSDFFGSVTTKWIDRVFAEMAMCPSHRFQILTSESARMREYMDSDPFERIVDSTDEAGGHLLEWTEYGSVMRDLRCWPLPNVNIWVLDGEIKNTMPTR